MAKKKATTRPSRPAGRAVCIHINVRLAVVDNRTRLLCRNCGVPVDDR